MKKYLAVIKDVYKIVEMRGGCIFKTKKIRSVWVPLGIKLDEKEFAGRYGGDMLVNSTRTEMKNIYDPTGEVV